MFDSIASTGHADGQEVLPIIRVLHDQGAVTCVQLNRGYLGKILGLVGIGGTIRDLELQFGDCGMDFADELCVRSLPGLVFEIDPAGRNEPCTDFFGTADWRCSCFGQAWFLEAPITCFSVFPADRHEVWDSNTGRIVRLADWI